VAGKQAKILSEDDLEDLLVYASATRNSIRNRLIVLLSAKAGLRAGEIAQLTWDMVVDANGAISTAIELRDHAAKKRSGRMIRCTKICGMRCELARHYTRHRAGRAVRARRRHDPAKHRCVVRSRISSCRP
jgi:integrase